MILGQLRFNVFMEISISIRLTVEMNLHNRMHAHGRSCTDPSSIELHQRTGPDRYLIFSNQRLGLALAIGSTLGAMRQEVRGSCIFT